jgi:hypothetical protein
MPIYHGNGPARKCHLAKHGYLGPEQMDPLAAGLTIR